MKRLGAALIAVLLLLVTASPVFSIGEKMNVYYGTPWIDGEIDPIWKRADRQKLSWRTGGEGKKQANSLAYVSVLWDDEALYFLFELIDNDFTFEAEPGSELNDCVYVYIDEPGIFGPTWTVGQNRSALTPALGKSVYAMNGDGPKDYEMAFSFDIDGHAIIEYKYVPSMIDLKNAGQVLVDFQYNDANPNGTLDYRWNWSDEIGECDADSASWTYITLKAGGGLSSGEGYETLEAAAAAINRTPIKTYMFRDGTEGNHNEGPNNIWDNNVGTKFCTSTFPMKSVARLKTATVIDGVIMATANDNSSYHGRNPNEWKIQGSTNGSDWVDILTGNESFFQDVDFTYFAAAVEDTQPFRFVRFRNGGCVSGCCQISEVVLCSTDEATKSIVTETVVHEESEKDALVNYESMTRASKNAPAEEPEPTAPAPAARPGNTPSPAKSASPVPGIAAAAVFLVLAVAGALILPKKLNE